MNKFYTYLLIYATFFIGFVITIIPWASEYMDFKPYWVLVLLIYWSHTEPDKILYFTPLVLGVVLDSITNSLLGHHAISFIIITFLTRRLYAATRTSGALVELLTIAFIILCYYVINNILGLFTLTSTGFSFMLLLPVIISTFVWWWFKFILDYIQYSLGLKYKN